MKGKSAEGLVVLVTGATSGIGKAIASGLVSEGASVYGTGRDPAARSNADKTHYDIGVNYLPLDTRSEESVETAVSAVLGKEGRLDVLVACAGMGIAGAVEDTDIADVTHQMDVNFLGTVRTIKACLSSMRRRGSGKIIVIGSIAGRVGMPFQAFYSSSKFALEGFVESLRQEVKKFGIEVCIVEPGDFHTGFTGSREKAASLTGGAYDKTFLRVISVQEHDELLGSTPDKAAKTVISLVNRKSLPVRVTTGPAFQRFACFLKRIIPASWFEAFFKLYYKL